MASWKSGKAISEASKEYRTDSLELLTIEDVAALLKVSPKTIYNWTYRDIIPHLKLGRGILRFRREEIIGWMNQQSL